MRSSLKRQFTDLCYRVPVALIAEWLSVSTSVATQYKNGKRVPSPAAFELFKLKLEGRVVPDEWEGFCFRGGRLWDPSGKPFNHGHLRAYELGLQLLSAFARGDAHRTRQVDGIFSASGLGSPKPRLVELPGIELQATFEALGRIRSAIRCRQTFLRSNEVSGEPELI
jgi:hypothetical protein